MALSNAAWTIAEWAGSAVVGKLIETGFTYLRDHVLPADNKAELERLKEALPQIKAVMSIAEALKVKHPDAIPWVEQIRQAVEASEDVLDELEYKKLEDKVKDRDEASGSASSSKKRKLSTINDDTLERLKKAVTMLDQAANGVENLLRLAKSLGIHDLSESRQEAGKVLSRETSSFLTETKVFGREVEKEKIIGWLKQPTDGPLSSFGIVGVGGLGKTTLAQFAYQEMHGSNHFDKTIWVCVSTNFNVEDITKKMLGELGESSFNDKQLNALQETLKEKIHSKKLLIILDDLWDDEKMSDWEQLVVPLRFVQQGSKILFTTRMKSVVDLLKRVIHTEHESLTIQGLEEQELRLLFESYAFYGFNLYNHGNLREIGVQILKILRGSPLAAKVIGSLLNSRMDEQYWRRVLNQGSLFNLKQANNVVEVLKLSYYHLPSNLQVCFRFCSIFSQDHEFDKDDLIKMWICSGFVRQQSSQEERPEDIGEDYFDLLLRKSFFELRSNKEKTWYTMHDLIHELAQNVSYGECCRIEDNNEGSTIPSTIRHAFVDVRAIDRVSHLENLRSLVIYGCDDLSSLNKLIRKPLRLLKVEAFDGTLELPKEISCFVHLRYLSIGPVFKDGEIQFSSLGSIYKLYHLQLLEFSPNSKNTTHLTIETTGITNLLRLRYMRLPNHIIKTICAIHKLTSLQELTFCIGKEIGYRIDELRTLNNLRHLSIKNIENIGDHTEAERANLLGKNNLMSLSLKWTIESNPIHPEKLIDRLRPPPSLMELTIKNYNGQRCPNWMEDSPSLNLSSLKLLNCPLWKNQLFYGNMPYLKILDIRDCQNLVKLPDMPLSLIEFRIFNVGLTSLPALYQNYDNNTSALRAVKIKRCPNLISLHGFLQQDNLHFPAIEKLTITGCERLVHMPTHGFGKLTSLKYLKIMDCPNLTEYLTLLPLSLIEFRIKNVGLSALPEYYQSPNSSSGPSTSSLKIVEIENCQNLRSLNGFLQQDNIDFPAIEELTIRGCKRLVHLPTHGFGKLTSLEYMEIMDCPNLTEFPTFLPLSVTQFRIKNVGLSALPEYIQSADSSSGPSTSSLKIVKIENCQNLISLNGFLQQDNIDFPAIEKLTITGCKILVHLPTHGFGKLTSLEYMEIMDCPNLTEYLTLLPLSLIEFRIKNVGLSALPEYYQSPNSSSGPSTSSLEIVEIENCQNLISLNGFLQQDNIDFPAIEKLTITGCKRLVHLPTHGFGKLTSLEYLEIMDCPNLTEYLTFLPLSLIEFRIKNVGLSALPEYYQSPNSSSGPSTSSLEIVEIENCQNLISLNGFLQQDNIDFQSIEKIEVDSCKNPVHLPMGAFGKFVSLQELTILDCPMLMAVDKQSTLLPMALENLSGCKKLIEHSFSEQAHAADRGSSLASLKIENLDIDNLSLLLIEPLRSLSFVSKLDVFCSGMEALPEQWFLQNSSTLKRLNLWDVTNLNTLPATMARLTVLVELTIYLADLLEELPELPASLRMLEISGAKSLKSLPATMVRLTVLEELKISQADLLEELPELPASLRKLYIWGAKSLKSLPATMAGLTALETLEIDGADLLEELPKLPASLKEKKIEGCGGRLLDSCVEKTKPSRNQES